MFDDFDLYESCEGFYDLFNDFSIYGDWLELKEDIAEEE